MNPLKKESSDKEENTAKAKCSITEPSKGKKKSLRPEIEYETESEPNQKFQPKWRVS